ncbi:MAG: hypothetical protein MI867_20340 [Pseudomonadales bacterium]|nr:hypothetical protein [Pseudomonadales bacterium]
MLAAVLISPALIAGFMGDDFIHLALFKSGLPVSAPNDASLFGLFSFMDADPIRNKELMDLGLLPWWTFPDMKYAFWRPMTELTHGLDALLWPGNSILMHLHSIIWYLALCFLVYKLFELVFGKAHPTLVLLGLALYALDSSHGFTLSWIANRNGLIAATFGIASIYTYIDSQKRNSFLIQLSSIAFLALALFSAEIGISTVGYLGAFALFLDKRGWFKGCLALLPHMTVVILWWLLYKSLGFGAANADAYYIDPVAAPVEFLTAVLQRLTVLFGSQWGFVPAEIYGFAGKAPLLANLVLLIAIVICSIALAVSARALKVSALARFWFFGALFSALPVCSALPHDRLLLFIGVGAIGLILEVLRLSAQDHQDIDRFKGKPTLRTIIPNGSRGMRFLFSCFFGFHLIISPLFLPFMAYSPKLWADQIDMAPASFPKIANLSEKHLILFNVPISSSQALTVWRFNNGKEIPRRLLPISNYVSELTLTKTAVNEFEISKENGFIQNGEESVRNLSTQPFRLGEQVHLNGLTISIIEINEANRPSRIKLAFEPNFKQENLVFLSWDKENNQYLEIKANQIGEAISF